MLAAVKKNDTEQVQKCLKKRADINFVGIFVDIFRD